VDAALTGCRHCGLPARIGEAFCCFGCEIAHGIAAEGRDDHASLHATLAFIAVLSMIVMMLSLFLYAEDVFHASDDVELAWLRGAYRWASWALATPVMVLGGWPLARRAWSQLRAGRPSMDALIVAGALAAYALSVPAVLRGGGGVWFEAATAAIVLATLGRTLEATARARCSASLGPLLEVGRGTVRACAAGGDWRPLAATEIGPGMLLEVDAEQIVPVDLRLEDEAAEVDLAVLSGESRPVVRARGQTVPAGAVPVGRRLRGVALADARDSALERLAAMAKGLAEHRTAVQRLADRFAAALTPLAGAVALGALLVHAARGSIELGIASALAVVLAACPCAYAIASPLCHWLALRRAFSRGVLIRGADTLEALAATRVVAFDKTGTLTNAGLRVGGERLAEGVSRGEVMSLLRALEAGGAHPVARALFAHAAGHPPAPISDRRFVPGRGVFGVDSLGRAISLRAGPDGAPTLARDGLALARFELAETVRPEAQEAVAAIRRLGVGAVVLSGDGEERVRPVADALGLEAHAGLGPEDKVGRLTALGDGVAMVGDGVNDAPALAGRATGFTLRDAAPLALGVAQVSIGDLSHVPWAIELGRETVRRVRTLLLAATTYNVVFVALAAAGWLRPVWAGVSMLGSSLLSLAFAVRGGVDAADGHLAVESPPGREQEAPC
jgi:Cu2+-exporting ATPase